MQVRFARQFNSDDLSLVKTDERLLLRSRLFDDLVDANSVRAEADRIVDALSGISRLLLRSEDRLKVSSVTQERGDGTRHTFLQAEPGVLRLRGGLASIVITRANGTVEERRPSDPVPRWLARALGDPAVARALRL
jgi:hypothetical protein